MRHRIAVSWAFDPRLDLHVCEARLDLDNVVCVYDIAVNRHDLENVVPGHNIRAETERRAKEELMYRNHEILDLPRLGEIACQYCGKRDGTVVMAHSNQLAHGKGKGIKAHDCFVAALCFGCHHFVDQGRGMALARATVWGTAHDRTVPLFSHLLDNYGRQLLDEAA